MSKNRFQIANTVIVFAFFIFAPSTQIQAQPLFEEVSAQLDIIHAADCPVPFWYDYDLDNDLDLLMGERFMNDITLYRRDGLNFTHLTNIGLPVNWDGGPQNGTDFDHDGDIDLFFRCYHTPSPLMAYENGHFIDRTNQVGLPWETGNQDYDWVDYNMDGWTDLLYGHYTSGFHLFRNDQGTHFEDITDSLNLPFIASFAEMADADIDLDGDIDLFITSHSGTDYLFVNQGNGSYVDWTFPSGLSNARGKLDSRWVDINGDKLPDLLTQGLLKHTIWLNNGDLTFTEMNVHGTEVSTWGDDIRFGAWYAVADFDMDGDYDIYVGRPGNCGYGRQPNQFLIQDSLIDTDIWFHDIAPQLGMNFMEDGNPTVSDFDNDGDMDLTVPRYGETILFYRNLTNETNYLQVQLEGSNGNRDCWHSRIEIYAHGSMTALRTVELNTSNVGRNGIHAYFVLNANDHYDLRISFPNGTYMTPEDYPSLSDIVPSQIGHQLTVRLGVSAVPRKPLLASEFRLDGAFPNPFNARTSIRFSLPAAAKTNLSLFDVEGRRVATLLDGSLSAGTHDVAWDASSLATGIYFSRLQSGSHASTAKLVLIK